MTDKEYIEQLETELKEQREIWVEAEGYLKDMDCNSLTVSFIAVHDPINRINKALRE